MMLNQMDVRIVIMVCAMALQSTSAKRQYQAETATKAGHCSSAVRIFGEWLIILLHMSDLPGS